MLVWNREKGGKGSGSRGGFALLLALGLTAFVVLLLAGLGTVLMTRMRSHESRSAGALARQEARYALRLALAQLQDHAGPDRRATARAEILGADVIEAEHRLWTGVWQRGGRNLQVRWLVTEPADPEGRPDPARVLDERDGITLSGHPVSVRVPLVGRRASDAGGAESLLARHAWWTSDEGVKASLLGIDLREQMEDEGARTSVASRANPGPGPASFAAEVRVEATGIRDWLQLRHGEEAGLRLHPDFSLNALGLLTNSGEGGLRQNLEDPGRFSEEPRFDDVFSRGEVHAVWKAMPGPDEDGRVPVVAVDAKHYESLAPGRPYLHVAPVLSECALHFSAYERRGVPSLRYLIRAELWNPFTRPLLLRAGDRRGARVKVHGLPEIRLRNLDTSDSTEWRSIDDMPRSHAGGEIVTDSWIEIDSIPGASFAGDAVLEAGEVYQLDEPDPTDKPDGIWKHPGLTFGEIEADEQVLLEGRFPENGGGVGFQLRAFDAENGALWSGVGDLRYRSGFVFRFGPDMPYQGVDYDIHVMNDYVFAFHYKLGGRWDDPSWAATGWLSDYDARVPMLSVDDGGDGQAAPVRVVETHPLRLNSRLSGVFSGMDLLHDRIERDSTPGFFGELRLHDLPDSAALTIADFRHLSYKGLPPLALGSPAPEAGDLNRSFDRYFLSTVPAEEPVNAWEASGRIGRRVFRNTRLHLAPSDEALSAHVLRGPDAARFFRLRGVFNWNSTSIRAWEIALSMKRESFAARREPGGELEGGVRLIYRDNFSGDAGDAWTDAEFARAGYGTEAGRSRYFSQGVRVLEERALRRLADAVVAQLQGRGEPSLSLGDFLDAGILQRAIADSGINEGFPGHTKGHVTQSDLAALLSLAASTRSDSFRIRAYGEVLHPLTGRPRQRALLEAEIQRQLEFVDGREVASIPAGVDEGPGEARRFRIVSFRWLDPSDIH